MGDRHQDCGSVDDLACVPGTAYENYRTGQFAASIADEVNQPNAATVTNVQAARRWLDPSAGGSGGGPAGARPLC
jgi:hypothetical protein